MVEEGRNREKKLTLHRRWYEAHSLLGMWVLLPLFIMLACGTISFFRDSLKAWHTPAMQHLYQPSVDEKLSPEVEELIQSVPTDASFIAIYLPNEDVPITKVRHKINGKGYSSTGATSEGEIISSSQLDTKVVEHIYKWHYLEPLPGGRYVAGLIALIWLSLTINGFYLHRKKLFSQFNFRKKRKGGALQSWLHTITATLTFPFHFIYGVTGVIFNLSIVALPVTMLIAFDGDRNAMMEQFTGVPSDPKPSGELVNKIPELQPFIDQARLELNQKNAKLKLILIRAPFDQNGMLNIRFAGADEYQAEVKFLHNESKDVIFVNQELKTSGINKVLKPIFKLHFGDYSWFIKCIYVLMGVFLCLLTTAGARLYISRKKSTFPRATQFFERLFDGLGLGIFPAIAILALSNRLLPADLVNRGAVEIYIFQVVWVVIGLIFLIFGTSARRRQVIFYTALSGLFLIPWLDGLLYQNWLWGEKIWIVPNVGRANLVLLTLLPAVILLQLAYKKSRARRP